MALGGGGVPGGGGKPPTRNPPLPRSHRHLLAHLQGLVPESTCSSGPQASDVVLETGMPASRGGAEPPTNTAGRPPPPGPAPLLARPSRSHAPAAETCSAGVCLPRSPARSAWPEFRASRRGSRPAEGGSGGTPHPRPRRGLLPGPPPALTGPLSGLDEVTLGGFLFLPHPWSSKCVPGPSGISWLPNSTPDPSMALERALQGALTHAGV